MNTINKKLVLTILSVFMVVSCATDEFGNPRSLTRTEKGAMIGAATGVLLGLSTNKKKKNAVLYGLVGGLAGGAVGSYMDAQRKDFEKVLKDEINSGAIELHKLPENNLMVTMTSRTAFEVNSVNIKSGFHSTMNKVAKVVNKYGKTHLNIVGHTDSSGSSAYNQRLSERRAASIEGYLSAQNVIPERMSVYGAGEDQPRMDNKTESGRRMNRRVEIVIEPVVSPS